MRRIAILIIITLYSYTLINKLLNIDAFLLNIAQTGLFRGFMVNVVASYALLSELICVILLVLRERVGCFVSLLVMLSYTLYLLFLGLNDRYEVCGCGGVFNGLPFLWHLFLNVLVITILLFLCINERKN